MNKKLLSICIPTYNRSFYLQTLLNSIEDEVSNNPHLNAKIEVIVSNNNSQDDTDIILQTFASTTKLANFKCFNNNVNIRFIKNLISIIQKSNGKYWYFIGDDDMIVKGSLIKVVDLLERFPEKELFIFNQLYRKDIRTNKELSLDDCLKKYSYYMGNAVSICKTITSIDYLKKYPEDIRSTCWPQTHIYVLCALGSQLKYPICVSTIILMVHQKTNFNNYANSFYHLDAQFLSFIKLTNLIKKETGKCVKENFLRGVPMLNGFGKVKYLYGIMCCYKLHDFENEKRDFNITLQESKEYLTESELMIINKLQVLKCVPSVIFFWLEYIYGTIYQVLRFFYHSSYSKIPSAPIFVYKKLKRIKSDKMEIMANKHSHIINKGGW